MAISPFPKTKPEWAEVLASPYRQRQGHADKCELLDVGGRDRAARAHQFIAGVVLGTKRGLS